MAVEDAVGSGTPAAVLCSVMAARPDCEPCGAYPPHRLLNDDTPASNNRRFVAGDDQVPCVIFSRSSHMLADSGEVVALPSGIQSSARSRHGLPVFTSAPPAQLLW